MDNPRAVSRSPHLLAERHILLADDMADGRRLLAAIFQRAGARVSACANGREAIEAAVEAMRNATPFDAVVLDIAMPVLDGHDAARGIRAAGYAGPIIALTAQNTPGDRDRSLAAGCDAYLLKPVHRAQLLTTLAEAIAGRPVNKHSGIVDPPPTLPNPPPEKTARKSLLESLPAADRTKLLADFLSTLVERAEQMGEAHRQKDREELLYLAHSVHGTAYLFGYREIAEMAGQIERQIRDGVGLELLVAPVERLLQLCRAESGGTGD